MHKVILKPGKANPFWHHEPIVFSGAILRVDGLPQVASLVEVQDNKFKTIGIGLFNPHSIYRVRLLIFHDEPQHTELADILQYRLQHAMNLRKTLGLPNAHTNAYRLINSEGDGLSGLTIDVFADHLVIAPTAFWVMEHQKLINNTLQSLFPHAQLHWLPSHKALQQDGWKQIQDKRNPELATIKEHDLLYQVDVSHGQKTGFYCDQRDNRLFIRKLAENKRVLDCYCYTGGFALNAAIGGAKSVVGVDSSGSAISLARQNAKDNHLNQVEFIQAKAEDYLQDPTGFDVIILDPPKLAPSKKHLGRAKQYYLKLNYLALRALPINGQMLTCSCSDAMNQELFIQTIQQAAKKAGRKIQIQQVLSASPDHRTLAKAQYGSYLKAVWLLVIG